MKSFSSIVRVCLLASTYLTIHSSLTAAGFANVQQTEGALLSGIIAENQGRTALIAYHNGILFSIPESPGSRSGSDLQVRTWNISDPTNPQELAQWGVTPQPGNAHGYTKSGDYLIIGPNGFNVDPWSFRADGALGSGQLTRTQFPSISGFLPVGVRGGLMYPFYVREYWSYSAIPEGEAGYAELRRGTPFTQEPLASWDHIGLTGVIGHPFVVGNLLIYASDQSRTGVATYDISDLSNPVLLDVLTTGGAGGYWPELWGSGDGSLYVVFPYRSGGNGMRVVDVTDPSNIEFVTDIPLSGQEAMYCQFQDEFAFIGNHKIDMRTYQSVLDFHDPANGNGDTTYINVSQFALPIGNLLVTGGVDAFQEGAQGMAIWAHQADPDTRGPYVAYHIPRSGETNYPQSASISLLIHETLETPSIANGTSFIVRPVGGDAISGILSFAFDDILTFTPDSDLLPNTTYEVILPAGGIEDAAGNGMEEYSFTFSTGDNLSGNLAPVISSYTSNQYPLAPGVTVTLSATAADPEGSAIEYRFDYGDGSPKTAWGNSASVDVSYSEPGHYKTSVQVRDTDGSISSAVHTVTAVNALPQPQPTHSGPILCDDNTGYVWTVNPDNNTVTAVDSATLQTIVEAPVGRDPRSIALASDGNIWVTCHDDDQIDILAGDTGLLIQTIPLDYGSAPMGIVMSPDGNTAFVALYGSGDVVRFNAVTRVSTGSTVLGDTPFALAVTADGGNVLVTRLVSPQNHGEVWDVDTGTMTLARTIQLPKFGGGPDFPGTPNLDGTASGRGVPNYLAGIIITPDNQRVWISGTKTNTERGTLFTPDLDQDNTVRNILCAVNLATGQLLDNTIDLDNSISAKGMAYSPLGDYLLVTLEGNDGVLLFDALKFDSTTGTGALLSRLDVGAAPQGVCVDPTTNRIFVKNFMDRSITVLDADSFFQTGDSTMTTTTVGTVSNEQLDPEILLGKQIFYNASDERMSAEGYMTCATCHVDGGHDGRTWDFTGRGEGLRNTTSLRGRAGMGHGNVHWTANFDEIQDFENDIRNGFGGEGFLTNNQFSATSDTLGTPKAGLSSDLDSLAAYVASLRQGSVPRSPHRDSDGSLTTQGEAGRALFNSMNCADCHTGASFTNSTAPLANLMDVGTIRTTSGNRLGQTLNGLDVPTLHGIWATAPYFHDGSAPTLEDVFSMAGGTVIPGETGTLAGSANIVAGGGVVNSNDDSAHGRAFANLETNGSVSFNNVEVGSAGTGAIEIRYTLSNPRNVRLTVNGVNHEAILPATGNSPTWRQTHWLNYRWENISFNANDNNDITITMLGNWPPIGIDNLIVSTPDDLAQALPHRQVLSLTPSEQADLMAYLRQLDGRPEDPANPNATFADWINANELNGIEADPASDGDLDNILLAEEYLYDLNPYTYSSNPVQGAGFETDQNDDQFFTFLYRRNSNAGNASFVFETSSDLSIWTAPTFDSVNAIQEVIDPDIDGDGSAELIRYRIRLNPGETRLFGRIETVE